MSQIYGNFPANFFGGNPKPPPSEPALVYSIQQDLIKQANIRWMVALAAPGSVRFGGFDVLTLALPGFRRCGRHPLA